MFIGLNNPEVVDIYRTKDKTSIRVREKDMQHGRLWLNLTFDNDTLAGLFVNQCLSKLNEPLPEE